MRNHIPDQTGRTVIVTGANRGLGLATTRWLARHGAHVIMAVRDIDRGHQAVAGITAEYPKAGLEVRRLDVADLESVRAFADGMRATGGTIDVLINNAGVAVPTRKLSPQGHELHFATNHLGPFALTGLLLDRFRGGGGSRVVAVSSIMHRIGWMNFDDLTGARAYSPRRFYPLTKLANVLFGLELNRRLAIAGSDLRSVVAHPGFANTEINTTSARALANAFGLPRLAVPFDPVCRHATRMLAMSSERAALPQVYAATAPGADGGDFLAPQGLSELWGHPTVIRPSRRARDPQVARRLWELSEELTGVRYLSSSELCVKG